MNDGDVDRDTDEPVDSGQGGDGPGQGGERDLRFAVLGRPEDGPTLDLDHERFAYAGKFVVSGTGKAVVLDSGSHGDGERGEVLAAAAFDRDRTDRSVVRVRYVTVRRDRRGEGLGARLLASLSDRVLTGAQAAGARMEDARSVSARSESAQIEGVESVEPETEEAGMERPRAFEDVREVRIAVNNPFAYEAAFKAGFGYTGEQTGIAELLCARPGDRSAETYRLGLASFLTREDLDEAERAFVDERRDAGPPATVAPLPDS